MAFFLGKGRGGGIRDLTLGRKAQNVKVCVPCSHKLAAPGMAHPRGNLGKWGTAAHPSSKMLLIARFQLQQNPSNGCTELQ